MNRNGEAQMDMFLFESLQYVFEHPTILEHDDKRERLKLLFKILVTKGNVYNLR